MVGEAPPSGYGWGVLFRHIPQSLTRMRRVTREMQTLGVTERWRFAAFVVVSAVMAFEMAALQAVFPDPFLADWRTTYGDAAVVSGVFVAYLTFGVLVAYALGAILWLVFWLFRRRVRFADMRTAMASSNYPQAALSAINLAMIASAAAMPDWRPAALSAVEASVWLAGILAIGYGVVAVAAATGVNTLQVLGLQVLAGLLTIFAAVAGAWAFGLVI